MAHSWGLDLKKRLCAIDAKLQFLVRARAPKRSGLREIILNLFVFGMDSMGMGVSRGSDLLLYKSLVISFS